MSNLYTKDGVPLTVNGAAVFNRDGKHIGNIQGGRVFGPHGHYVGTVDGDRLVYRSVDSSARGSVFAPQLGARSAQAHAVRSAMWGDEPDIR